MFRRHLLRCALGVPLAAALAGCGGGSDGLSDPFRLTVRAEDPFGLPVPRVRIELRDENASVVLRTGATGDDGTLKITLTGTDALPGDFSLTIVPPPDYALAPGEPSVRRVSIRSRDGVTVVVVLIAL